MVRLIYVQRHFRELQVQIQRFGRARILKSNLKPKIFKQKTIAHIRREQNRLSHPQHLQIRAIAAVPAFLKLRRRLLFIAAFLLLQKIFLSAFIEKVVSGYFKRIYDIFSLILNIFKRY